MDLAHNRIVGSFGVLTMQRLLFLFFLHDLLHHIIIVISFIVIWFIITIIIIVLSQCHCFLFEGESGSGTAAINSGEGSSPA